MFSIVRYCTATGRRVMTVADGFQSRHDAMADAWAVGTPPGYVDRIEPTVDDGGKLTLEMHPSDLMLEIDRQLLGCDPYNHVGRLV